MDNRLKNRKDRIHIILIAVLCILYMLFNSPYSFMYRYCFDTDEICYMVMSKGILSGKVPYRDLFDHKGPLTYVLYMLGLLISGNRRIGIFFIFLLLNIATLLFAYKISRKYVSPLSGFIGVVLVVFLNNFSTGSKPEHILVFLLLLSINKGLEYLSNVNNKQYIMKKSDIFFHGLLCGIVFLIKLNVCIYYLCFIGAYYIWLLSKKELKELISSVAIFIGGILVSVIPTFLYLLINSAFNDFVRYYFLFNMDYATMGSGNRQVVPAFKINFIALLILLMCAFYVLYKKSKNVIIVLTNFILTSIVIIFIAAPTGFDYTLWVLCPLMMLGTSKTIDFLLEKVMKKKFVLGILTLLYICICFLQIWSFAFGNHVPKTKTQFEIDMEKYIGENPNSSCLFLDCICDTVIYDLTDGLPNNRMFYLPMKASVEMINNQIVAVMEQKPDLIELKVSKEREEANKVYLKIIEESGYELYAREGDESNGRLIFIHSH